MSTRNTDNSQNTNMGPDHTALLLSGPDEETPSGPVAPPQPPGSHSINSVAASDGTETSPTEGITQSLQRVRRRMLDRLSAFDAAAQSFQDAVSDVQSSRPHLHSESSENRRAHLLDPLVRVRRDTDPSDSSTIIGRRVAARTALNASRSGPRPGSSGLPEHSTLPLLDDTAARIMALADSLQQDLNELMRRRESHAARAAVTAAARYDSQLNAAASASLAGLRGVTSTEQGSTGEYGLEALLREINRGDGDTSLQLLQRSSATNNASADAPRSRSRADIIMDSWASELDNPPLPPLHEDSTRPFSSWFGDEPTDYSATRSEVTEHRTYRVRRRLNSDGEEYVHSIRMDDSEDVDPFSWMRPEGSRHPRLRPREGTSVPTSSNSDSRQRRERVDQIRRDIRSTTSDTPRRRRRGWARIDQDGNEVPTDEEEEYERTRAQMRARATALAQPHRPERRAPQLPPPPPPPMRRRPLFYSGLVDWRHASDSNPRSSDLEPSLRDDLLSAPRPWSSQETLISPQTSSTESVASPHERSPTPQVLFGSSVPFRPSPLPLPLAETKSTLAKRRHCETEVCEVRVPSKFFMAGC